MKEQLMAVMQNYLPDDKAELIANALYNAYIFGNGSVSTIHLSQEEGMAQAVMVASKLLSKAGLVTSKATKKYASLTINLDGFTDSADLEQEKYYALVDKFSMTLNEQVYSPRLQKLGSDIVNGLASPGLQLKAKTAFRLDTAMMAEHKDALLRNLLKGFTKQQKLGRIEKSYFMQPAAYTKLCLTVMNNYISNPQDSYNSEFNIADSRGRAIYQSVKRIFNPISNKDSRALLISDRPVFMTPQSTKAIDEVYYFIGELVGNSAKYEFGVIAAGMRAYNTKQLPPLTDSSLHEFMHLTRLYKALDTLFTSGSILWDIPIEIDSRASALQWYGVITNDRKPLLRTSLIGTKIVDPWDIPGVPRLLAKSLTPRLYGSSASFKALAESYGTTVTKAQERVLAKTIGEGDFSSAIALKTLLIKHSSITTPVYTVKVGNNEWQVKVNKFKVAGYKPAVSKAWDTLAGKFRISMIHVPIMVPDYKAYATYMPTGLIHHLDRNGIEHVCVANPTDWMIPIHDAIIGMPGYCTNYRKQMAAKLKDTNLNREQLLFDYMKSIGAWTPAAKLAYIKLMGKVEQLTGDEQFNAHAMK